MVNKRGTSEVVLIVGVVGEEEGEEEEEEEERCFLDVGLGPSFEQRARSRKTTETDSSWGGGI